MNRPQEHVDQLLSGYLDDALTADERAEVESLLREDASIAAQYDELQSIHRTLQSIAKADQKRILRAGFSGRVMEASVARARAEGVSEDHPLIRVSEQPTSLVEHASATSWTKVASAWVAIAASVAVAFFAVQPDQSEVAKQVSPKQNDAPPLVPRPDTLATAGDADSVTETVMVADAMTPDSSSKRGFIDQAAPATVSPETEIAKQELEASPSNLAVASAMPADSAIGRSNAVASASVTTQLDVVLVIDVELTELGRATGAVRQAMRTSSILRSDQQTVGARAVTATLVASGQEEDRAVSIFFLQAPAKRLDQFYLRLLADEAGVASVGMTVATNIPISGTIDSVDIDPADVKHDGLLQVANPAIGMQELGSRLGQLSYLPFDAAMVDAGTPDSGVDFPTQVLVRVR